MKLKLINTKHWFNELLSLLNFIIKPVHIKLNKNTQIQKVKGTWRTFVFKTIFTIIIGVLVTLIYDPVNKTVIRWNEQFSVMVIFFLSILLFPLLEEIAFRLSLKFKPIYLSLTLGILSYNIATKAIYNTNLSNIDNHFKSRLLIGFVILLLTYSTSIQPRIKSILKVFWEANFKWIFYFFCFSFAWLHIVNYGITTKHLLLLPLITLPKLISAICYGYIRMHYGFAYSLGLHMCWNSFGFIMSLFPAFGTD